MDYLKLFNIKVFSGYSETQLEKLLKSLDAKFKSYEKGQSIYSSGQKVKELGLVETGSVLIQNTDIYGNTNIINIIEEGDIFAEAYSFFETEKLTIDVIAKEDSNILFLNSKRLFENPCPTCNIKNLFIKNLLVLTAQRNLRLTQRIFNTSPKSIRARVISYLSMIAAKESSNKFTIPLDRKGLADYLSLDRSALSKELGKMKKEGIIDFKKNYFEIKKIEEK